MAQSLRFSDHPTRAEPGAAHRSHLGGVTARGLLMAAWLVGLVLVTYGVVGLSAVELDDPRATGPQLLPSIAVLAGTATVLAAAAAGLIRASGAHRRRRGPSRR